MSARRGAPRPEPSTPLAACPECDGSWLYGLTWQHAVSCSFFFRDSATAAADHERGDGIRDMTPTEAALTAGQFEDPPEGWEWGVKFVHRGIHARTAMYRQGRYALPARHINQETSR